MKVVFTSYNGAGKTTLAMDTALYFAQCTGKAVLLAEATYGVSAILARAGLGGLDIEGVPCLSRLCTEGIDPESWRGVTLVPMDYENCQDFSADLVKGYFERVSGDYELVVFDVKTPHDFSRALCDLADRIFVLATPDDESVDNAKLLKRQLGEKAEIILNKSGFGDKLVFADLERGLELPCIKEPDKLDGRLARKVLAHIFGSEWRRHEKTGFWGTLNRIRRSAR